MIETGIRESFPGGQAALPFFSAEKGEETIAERMNRFYRTLLEAAKESASSLSGTSTARLVLQYRSRKEENGALRIEISVRLRKGGYTQKQQTLIHLWKDGWLCPPPKTKPLLSRFRRTHSGRRDR